MRCKPFVLKEGTLKVDSVTLEDGYSTSKRTILPLTAIGFLFLSFTLTSPLVRCCRKDGTDVSQRITLKSLPGQNLEGQLDT